MFCLKEGLAKEFTRLVMVSTLCVALKFISFLGKELVSDSTTLPATSTFTKDVDEDVNDDRRT